MISTLRRQQFTMASHRAVYLDRSCTADVPVIAGRHGVDADDTQLFLHTRAENSAVTFTRLQICIDDNGRAFQARAAATGKVRSPSVARRIGGTTSVDVAADRSH